MIILLFIDAEISSQPSNVSISINMSVTLNCTVKTSANLKPHDYKLLWMEGDGFVQSSDYYSLWTESSGTNIQHHYLIIHQVVNPATYTCTLLSTSYQVMDSKTQHIFLEKGTSYQVLDSEAQYSFLKQGEFYPDYFTP